MALVTSKYFKLDLHNSNDCQKIKFAGYREICIMGFVGVVTEILPFLEQGINYECISWWERLNFQHLFSISDCFEW